MKNNSVKYASFKIYYHGFIDGKCKLSYCCSHCLHSVEGIPGEICKGCGKILVEKGSDNESAN